MSRCRVAVCRREHGIPGVGCTHVCARYRRGNAGNSPSSRRRCYRALRIGKVSNVSRSFAILPLEGKPLRAGQCIEVIGRDLVHNHGLSVVAKDGEDVEAVDGPREGGQALFVRLDAFGVAVGTSEDDIIRQIARGGLQIVAGPRLGEGAGDVGRGRTVRSCSTPFLGERTAASDRVAICLQRPRRGDEDVFAAVLGAASGEGFGLGGAHGLQIGVGARQRRERGMQRACAPQGRRGLLHRTVRGIEAGQIIPHGASQFSRRRGLVNPPRPVLIDAQSPVAGHPGRARTAPDAAARARSRSP